MNLRDSRPLTAIAVVLACFVPVALTVGCSKPATEGAAGTAAASAAPAAAGEKKLPGAETPEALVERMKAGAIKEDFAEIAACLTPKNRTEMAMAMYMGATMMVAFADMGVEMGGAMAEGLSGMAGEASAEAKQKAEEQKAKAKEEVGKLKTAYNSLVTKYGLPAMPKEGEPEKPEPTQEEIEKLFANIDQGAFLNDALAVMKAMPGEHKDESGPVKVPEGGLENLKIEGDRATGTVGSDPFTFVRIDGRWYVEDLPKGASEEAAPADGAPTTTPGV
jgi:hypothetical protein